MWQGLLGWIDGCWTTCNDSRLPSVDASQDPPKPGGHEVPMIDNKVEWWDDLLVVKTIRLGHALQAVVEPDLEEWAVGREDDQSHVVHQQGGVATVTANDDPFP